jgi:shikimate kinase
LLACNGRTGPQEAWAARGRDMTAKAVVLVGFMGAGKSSVGRELARQLGWPFEDLDDRIETREGRSVEQIFQESGEAAFRYSEHLSLRELISELNSGPRVIALGGGAFAQASNIELLKVAGVLTVFLSAPADELFRRCAAQNTNRPLQGDRQQFIRLLNERLPYYARARFLIETTGKDVSLVAAEIGRQLGLAT